MSNELLAIKEADNESNKQLSWDVESVGTTTGTSTNSTRTKIRPRIVVTKPFDYSSFTRNAGNFITTVVFKSGGSGGTTTATWTVARDANNFITSITQT